MSDQAKPLSPGMVAVLLLIAEPARAETAIGEFVLVPGGQRRSANALVQRGFAASLSSLSVCYGITEHGRAALAAHDRIFGSAQAA